MTKKAEGLGHQPAPILENEQERLQDLDSLGIVKEDIRKDQRFSSLPRLASYLTSCPQAWINIIDKDTQHCKIDYGQNWHEAGMLQKKQNVFDDFIAAADYLKESGITSSDYLAIRGGSNGGLLIGAVLNQQPDICKVAFPEVGVMDMLRYEKFTIGYAWAVEYGSVKEQEHFDNLVKYSPLHTIKDGVEYPSV